MPQGANDSSARTSAGVLEYHHLIARNHRASKVAGPSAGYGDVAIHGRCRPSALDRFAFAREDDLGSAKAYLL
jgi:hypothetical protein